MEQRSNSACGLLRDPSELLHCSERFKKIYKKSWRTNINTTSTQCFNILHILCVPAEIELKHFDPHHTLCP